MPTLVEFRERIRVVRCLLREGQTREKIVDLYTSAEIYKYFSFVPENQNRLSKSTAKRDMRLILKRWAKSYQEHLDDPEFLAFETVQYLAELAELKQEARQTKNISAAHTIARDIAALKGITKDQVTGPVTRIYISGLPVQQIEGRDDQLEESRRLLADGLVEVVVEKKEEEKDV